MATGDQDYRLGRVCGRMVICGARHVGPDLPIDFEETRPLPDPGVLVGYTFVIGEEPPFYREPKRKWRANRWER